MAVDITREHPFSPEEVDAKMAQAVAEMAAANSLSVTEKEPRKIALAGMGVTGEVTWDEKDIRVKAEMVFAFGAADTQLCSAIEASLDHICGPEARTPNSE